MPKPEQAELESKAELPKHGQDKTPSVIDQAADREWRAGIFNFGLAEGDNIAHFNCSIIERPGTTPPPPEDRDEFSDEMVARKNPDPELFLMVRRAVFDGSDNFGRNAIWAFKLPGLTPPAEGPWIPEYGQRLRFQREQPQEHFEDPRCVFHNGQVWVGACTFIWYGNGKWTGAHQTLGVFNDEWACKMRFEPQIGGNGKYVDQRGKRHEKNWLWFFHKNKLAVIYHSNPWRIAVFGQGWDDATPFEHNPGPTWPWGDIRGGTPPVLAPAPTDEGEPDPTLCCYWTFFHSSMPWIGRFRRYYMGAVAFDPEPPFLPRYITKQPLLIGSQQDPWAQKKPLVVFPCGALLRQRDVASSDSDWLITFGLNDLKSGWISIPHDDLVELMVPIGQPDLFETTILKPSAKKKKKGGDALRTNAPAASATNTEPTNDSAPHLVSNGAEKVQPSSAPNYFDAGPVPIGGTGMHAIKCTCVEKDLPCPFHFRDNQTEGPLREQATVGDHIRFHVSALVALATNQNRKIRILAELRKRKLAPKARSC